MTLDGGPGDDRLEGRSIDRYVFGAAESSEVDTIVELGQPTCAPDFFGSNQFGSTWWTVPWDALDFTALAAGDPVSVAGAAPAGILARHRNRTILRAPTATGIAIEAIAGGAGDDVLAGACMVVGNAGDDRIAGTVEGDLALGGPGDDALAGAGGPDMLQGGAGADELQGDAGADTLAGGSGNDALAGGDDGDVYLFSPVDGPQSDAVDEHPAAGVDVLSFDFPSRRPVAVNLAAAAGVLATASGMTVTGAPGSGPNVEGAIGGAGGDRLVGHGGDNQFWSGGGTDLAIGAGGDDVYHVDWVASMPYGAYGYWEPTWGGPFERAGVPARSPYEVDEKPPSVLRIVERARGGRDTLDLAERFLRHSIGAGRLEGQLDEGVTVDLTARRLVEAAVIEVVAARPGASAHIEGVRGTTYDDRLIGNGAANVLEGRQGRDVVVGGRGHDTCLVHLREDALRGCERVRPADPDR